MLTKEVVVEGADPHQALDLIDPIVFQTEAAIEEEDVAVEVGVEGYTIQEIIRVVAHLMSKTQAPMVMIRALQMHTINGTILRLRTLVRMRVIATIFLLTTSHLLVRRKDREIIKVR